MNPALRELYDQEREAQARANEILADPNASQEQCNNMIASLEGIQSRITLAEAIENRLPEGGTPLPNPECEQPVYNSGMLYRALTNRLKPEERNVFSNVMEQYNAQLTSQELEHGGYLVPEDLATDIIRVITSNESLRNLVRVETVTAPSGRRVIEDGEPAEFVDVEELENIPDTDSPKYRSVPYSIRRFSGLMTIPKELLDDAAVNFIAEIRDWLARKARRTENKRMLYGNGVKGTTGIFHVDAETPYYTEKTAPENLTVEFLRSVCNSIDKGYRAEGRWIMNTAAQETIANIKDAVGRGLFAVDPRNPDLFTLFGRPVDIYDSIETDGSGETHIAFGDFKAGYRMFDRKAFEVALTGIGARAFETYSTKARGSLRFDGNRMDKKALVIVRGVKVRTSVTTDPGEGLAFASIDIDTQIEAAITEMLAEAQETITAMVEKASTDAAAIITAAEKEAKDKLASANKEAKAITDAAKKSDTGK
ncbi:MAG: phage major capsid protein [Defluviitaleaceae bacterium]|nr:phage major capsid protein [Defluviitaleaceae bacterium]